jgi:hypothetical protein
MIIKGHQTVRLKGLGWCWFVTLLFFLSCERRELKLAESKSAEDASSLKEEAKLPVIAFLYAGDDFHGYSADWSWFEMLANKPEEYRSVALDAKGNIELQRQQILEIAGQRPYGVILDLIDEEYCNEALKVLKSQGVQVIRIDAGAKSVGDEVVIGVDYFEMGKKVGMTVVQSLQKRAKALNSEVVGKVLMMQYRAYLQKHIDFEKGFLEVINEVKGIELAASLDIGLLYKTSSLEQYKNYRLSGMMADVVISDLGVITAAVTDANPEDRKQQLWITLNAYNTELNGVEMVRENKTDVAIVYGNPVPMAIDYLERLLKKDNFTGKKKYILPVILATPRNYNDIISNGIQLYPEY